MPSNYMRKLFFLLLAMVVLPMHVSAAHVDQSAHLPYLSKLQAFGTSKTSPNSDIDFSDIAEESTQAPVSQGHPNSDTLAIFDSQRRASYLREKLDDEDVDRVGNLDTSFCAEVNANYNFIDINWLQKQSVFYHFSNEHRISGWKETNAMYVALNSQFTS